MFNPPLKYGPGYKQERDSVVHFVRLANKLLKDEESVLNNHVLACYFAKYSLI